MPVLIVRDEGRTWLLDVAAAASVVIGRDVACDVLLATPRASRRHAELVPVEGGHAVRDLGSTNGTRVGDRVVAGADLRLADGDVIAIGGATLTWRSAP